VKQPKFLPLKVPAFCAAQQQVSMDEVAGASRENQNKAPLSVVMATTRPADFCIKMKLPNVEVAICIDRSTE